MQTMHFQLFETFLKVGKGLYTYILIYIHTHIYIYNHVYIYTYEHLPTHTYNE